jgi:hypothetical protein
MRVEPERWGLGDKLRPRIRHGRFLEEENYQTNPILFKPAWRIY